MWPWEQKYTSVVWLECANWPLIPLCTYWWVICTNLCPCKCKFYPLVYSLNPSHWEISSLPLVSVCNCCCFFVVVVFFSFLVWVGGATSSLSTCFSVAHLVHDFGTSFAFLCCPPHSDKVVDVMPNPFWPLFLHHPLQGIYQLPRRLAVLTAGQMVTRYFVVPPSHSQQQQVWGMYRDIPVGLLYIHFGQCCPFTERYNVWHHLVHCHIVKGCQFLRDAVIYTVAANYLGCFSWGSPRRRLMCILNCFASLAGTSTMRPLASSSCRYLSTTSGQPFHGRLERSFNRG